MINKLLYVLLPLVATLLYAANFIFNGTIFTIIGFVLILPYLFKYGNIVMKNNTLRIFVLLVFVGSILNLLTTQNGIGGTINFIACVGIALFCVNNTKSSGFLISLICFILLYYVYDAIFIKGLDVNLIFESMGQSRNYPGLMFVIFCCYWGFTKSINYNSYPLLMPVLALILCFFLEGRSSLGVMVAICIICLFYKGHKYLLPFLLVSSAVLFYYRNDIMNLFSLSRFASAGLETSRNMIWNAYFDSLDLSSFLFGLDTYSVPIIKSYGGNPHNAFLNFHYRMGLLGLIALFMLIFKSINVLLSKKLYIEILYIVLLLIRFFFDACIGGTFDFLFYTMLFYPLVKLKKSVPIINKKTQSFLPEIFRRMLNLI